MIPQEVSDRLSEVLELLRQRTMAGVIDWKTSDNSRQRHFLSIDRTSFMVGTRDGDGIGPYVFGMYNSQGSPVAVVDTGDPEYSDEVKAQIEELYTLVSTSAAQVMNFLDQAVSELNRLPPF